jgi:hypothetical protein
VQGALSLWSYAGDIPYAPGTAGYFQRILEQGLVRGPIVTTRSTHDTAVGRFYPLGAELKGQLVLAREEFPEYGGIGAFGIRGLARVEDMQMQPVAFSYDFRHAHVYNLDASAIVKNGRGPSGAHSDIAHPEVAHVFWAAALAGRSIPAAATEHGLGGLLGAAEPQARGGDVGGSLRGKKLQTMGGPGRRGPMRSLPDNTSVNTDLPAAASDRTRRETLGQRGGRRSGG